MSLGAHGERGEHGLRVVLYDDTCRGSGVGLTHSWIAGGLLYRALGRIDHFVGARSWDEGLTKVLDLCANSRIAELQYWGHGRWGEIRIHDERLDESALRPGHRWHPLLDELRARLAPDALLWLRTCESFGARRGHAFASSLADFFDCQVAGHTFIIGPWQSGLHSLRPGEDCDWPMDEGIAEGSVDIPRRALWSGPTRPHTITCLHGSLPARW